MCKPRKRPRDANQLAKRIVEVATGEVDETLTDAQAKAQKAGKARAESLTEQERSDIARLAANTRWNKS